MLKDCPYSNFSTIRSKLQTILCNQLELNSLEAKSEIDWIFEVTLKQRTNPLLECERTASPAELKSLENILAQRLARKPLAYILGEAGFYGYTFTVSDRVLIPRPESEQLIDLAKMLLQDHQAPQVLDIGTGSGCLAVTLALELRHRSPRISASDLSGEALTIARQNLLRHGVQSSVDLYRCDLLPAASGCFFYDLVISNPPYISADEFQGLSPEVQQEPRLALIGVENQDGLYYYQKLVDHLAGGRLNTEHMLLELDPGRAVTITDLFRPYFVCADLRPDYNGWPRVLVLKK